MWYQLFSANDWRFELIMHDMNLKFDTNVVPLVKLKPNVVK